MTGNGWVDFGLLAFLVGATASSVILWERLPFLWRRIRKIAPFVVVTSIVLAAWFWWGKEGVDFMVVNRWNEQPTQMASKAPDPKEASQLEIAGQAGDLFGGFNALISSLALVAAMGALLFQARAMTAAQDQLKLQQEQIARQSFEAMFLYLLETHRRLSSEFLIAPDGRSRTLDSMAAEWHQQLNNQFQRGDHVDDVAFLESSLIYFEEWIYRPNENRLGQYFRSLYHIFKAIKLSGLSDLEKARHANVARLTLNADQLFLVAANGLTANGRAFKPLIEEFGLLKHLVGEEGAERRMDAGQRIAVLGYRPTARMSAPRRGAYWVENPEHKPGPFVEI